MAYWHTHQLLDHGYLKLVRTSGYRSVAKTLAHVMNKKGALKMSQKTLAAQSCESVKTVQRALAELEDLKLISRHRQGRANAEVINWHHPLDCTIEKHTGKTDTMQAGPSKESTADGFPKPKRKRRGKTARVGFVPTDSVRGQADHTGADSVRGQIVQNPGVSDQLGSLKDKNTLNTEVVSISEKEKPGTGPVDLTQTCASLALTVEALALDDDDEAINSRVLLHLLDDRQHGADFPALTVEAWGTIPQPFTHGHAEELVRRFEKHTGKDAGPVYLAAHRYNANEDTKPAWANLTSTDRAELIRNGDLMQMSQVGPTLAETAPGYSFPAHDVQVANLTRRLSAITPE
jgi:hypothetical protein